MCFLHAAVALSPWDGGPELERSPQSKALGPSANRFADVSIITPAIHYTMGGIRIDSEARALGPERISETDEAEASSRKGPGSPIPGLFAAGEVTGGVHGANRLAGNSLLECVVIGRLAGQKAASEALARSASSAPGGCRDAGAGGAAEGTSNPGGEL